MSRWWQKNRKETEQPLREPAEALHTTLRDLRGDLEALAADVDWLSLEVKKLRGKVTGGLRGQEPAQDAPGPTNGHPPLVPGSPEWMAAENLKIQRR